MAEEKNPSAGAGSEEKGPIFSTGVGEFDRAKFNKSVETGGVDSSEIDKQKSVDSVIQKAKEYYKSSYETAIKKIDPAYDPKGTETIEIPELTYSSNLRDIKKSIEEGKTLEGARDIIPLAEQAAINRVNLTNKLKTASVSEIAQYLRTKDVVDMEGYEDVKKSFDGEIKNEKYKFEDLIPSFIQKIRSIDFDAMTRESSNYLYTKENLAIISGLAKILEKEGFSSENVKLMAQKFDDNLKIFVSSIREKSGEPIMSAQEKEEKTVGSKTGAEATGAAEKIEKKEEAKKQTEAPVAPTTPQSPASTEKEQKKEETPIEGNAKPAGEATNLKEESAKAQVENKGGTELQKIEESKKTETIEGNKTPEATGEESSGNRGADFIKDLFGGLLGIENEGKEEESGETEEAGSAVEFAKIALGETTKSTENKEKTSEEKKDISKLEGSATSTTGKEKESPKKMSTVEKVQEKISKAAETSPESKSIKETTAQKLSSPVSVEPQKTEKQSAQTLTGAGESNKVQESKESKNSYENMEDQVTKGPESKEASKEESNTSGSMSDLSKQMETMVGLLSQLNDTLSGPLLVTPTTKKFE